MTDKIIVRLANGLDAIEPEDQIDVISICGMGGTLIRDILEAGRKNRLTGKERLVYNRILVNQLYAANGK